MEKIRLTAKFQIQNGKAKEFKSVAEKCIVVVKDKELGKTCLQYDWFFNADESECHVLETYTNSDAVMAHMGNLADLLGQLTQFSSLSGEIYGSLSDELNTALQGIDKKLFKYFKGA